MQPPSNTPIENFLQEKNSLQYLLASGFTSKKERDSNMITDTIGEVMKEMWGDDICDQPCECLQNGEDDWTTELEEMTRDGESKKA